ncbi:MAG: RDD family protein, partial [Rhodospirillaceae bacterium]
PPAAATRSAQGEWAPAAPARRAAAAAIDLGLVLLIDVVVLHFTLALCGLTFGDLRELPALPMAAFLLMLNGGYLVFLTGTLGQTFGKMAAEIEVVSDGREPMNLRRAALRGAALVLSLLPAGLGWLAGLVGDHRGLHDRLSGTRVVRVPGA